MVPVGLIKLKPISSLKLNPVPMHAPVALSMGSSHLVRLMVVTTFATGVVKPEKVNPVLPVSPSTMRTGLKLADWVSAEAAGASSSGSARNVVIRPKALFKEEGVVRKLFIYFLQNRRWAYKDLYSSAHLNGDALIERPGASSQAGRSVGPCSTRGIAVLSRHLAYEHEPG